MLVRLHQRGDAASEAVFSACETYRYALTRVWGLGPKLLFVLLNPSTATEAINDPTVERCERRARATGFGAMRVINIFAYRATDPRVLRTVTDPVGPGNETALAEGAIWADQIICGWGGHGAYLDRGGMAKSFLRGLDRPLFHLGLTRAGEPKHPLYIGYHVKPALWG